MVNRNLLVAGALGCAFAAGPSETRATESFSLVERHVFLPAYRAESASRTYLDFDGDATNDIVYTGSNGNNMLVDIVGHSPQGLVRKQAFLTVSNANQTPYLPHRATPWHDASGNHIGVTAGNTLVYYSGWPLRKVQAVTIPGSARSADIAIDDINNDGIVELVTIANDAPVLTVHSVVEGDVLWQEQLPTIDDPTGLLLAQLDADPALEIVIATGGLSRGVVVDGATHAIEWTAERGVGNDLHLGRFLDSRASFLGTGHRWSLTASSPWMQVWDRFSVNSGVVATGDVDGDGIDEAVYAPSFGPGLNVMEVATREIRALSELEVINFLGVVDLDGTGRSEVVTSSNENPQMLRVRDGVSGITTSMLEREMAGGYMVSEFVTGETNPSKDLFVAAGGRTSFLRRVNASTGHAAWDVPRDDVLNLSDLQDVDLVERGMADRLEVVLTLNNDFGNGLLAFFDADDGKLLRVLDVFESKLGALRDSAVVTHPSGAARSILSCTADGLLREFRYPDGVLLWTSPNTGHPCTSVWATHGSGGHEFVYSHSSGLRAFNADTKEATWQLETVDGRTWRIAPDGEPEQYLVVRDDAVATAYDASTRKALRTFAIAPESAESGVLGISTLPGAGSRYLAVRSATRISVIDGRTGETQGTAATVGYFGSIRGGIATSRLGIDQYIVATAGGGTWIFDLTLPTEDIFSHGFEPPNVF
jgi:hypothetical protein